MKNSLLLLVTLGAALSIEAQAQTGKPKLQFDRTVYDFGTTSDVQQVSGTFVYQNTGDAELKLQKPAAACGCTIVSAKPDTLKPGEKGELQFSLNVGTYRGHVEKAITVASNDPDTPSVILTLKVDMKVIYSLEPERFSLADLRQGAVTNLSVLVRRTDGKPLVISKLEPSDNKRITAELEEPVRGDAFSRRVTLQFTADAPRRFTDNVRILGEDPGKVVGTVYLFGRIIGDVSLNPESLFWGISKERWSPTLPEQMTTRRVRITSNQTQVPLEVRNVVSNIKELQVEVQPIEPGKVFDIVARLTSLPQQTVSNTLTFETNLPGQPTVIVPVTINVLMR